uniref:cdc42 homolog n=1 Tax=Styela clava TaxID=7725 RepID=UPI00193A84C0|nr:cdc42 homolog [Styela clava]
MSYSGRSVKCVVMGDHASGQASLVYKFAEGTFPIDTQMTLRHYKVDMMKSGRVYSVELYPIHEELDEWLRALSYPETHVVLICFDVNSQQSYLDAKTKWVEEVKKYCPGVPFLLVGTKIDLRDEVTYDQVKIDSARPIFRAQGIKTASVIGAVTYVETSALRGTGVQNAFRIALNAAVGDEKRTRGIFGPPFGATSKGFTCPFL